MNLIRNHATASFHCIYTLNTLQTLLLQVHVVALSSYLQVCFSITNDVVMSIFLMYEQPESILTICRIY